MKIFNVAHPLTNFEIEKYYEIKIKFNGVCSRNNLSKIKDVAFIINLDEYESIETHWIALYVNDNNVKYFDSSGFRHIQKEIKKSKIKNWRIFVEYKHMVQ